MPRVPGFPPWYVSVTSLFSFCLRRYGHYSKCGRDLRLPLPRRLEISPYMTINQPVYLLIEVDSSSEAGKWASVIVTVQLQAWHTGFLDSIFLFDTGAKYIRFIDGEQFGYLV